MGRVMRKVFLFLLIMGCVACAGELSEDFTKGQETQFMAMCLWVGEESAKIAYKKYQSTGIDDYADALNEATDLWLEHISQFFDTQRSFDLFIENIILMLNDYAYMELKLSLLSESFRAWVDKNIADKDIKEELHILLEAHILNLNNKKLYI